MKGIFILALLGAVALIVARPAQAAVYELTDPNLQVIGEDLHITTHYSDTLVEIARRYGLGYEEMVRANPKVDPWLPGEGTAIVIPGSPYPAARTPRRHRRQHPGTPNLLFSQAEERPDPHRRHLSGEHRQDGLADADGFDACRVQGKKPDLESAGLGARRTPGQR